MWLLRLRLLARSIIIVYRIISFVASPVRRPEFANRGNRFYLFLNRKNVRMNLLVPYKGFLFVGEKDVHSVLNKTVSRILLWPTEPYDTKLMDDLVRFLEESFKAVYPHSKNRLEKILIKIKKLTRVFSFFFLLILLKKLMPFNNGHFLSQKYTLIQLMQIK
ncbi:hypothetical protein NDK25_07955 [Niallia taxi]|nr:hypothetical protein [Niallia taxi]MDE5052298.1 hypothetical protein [Niallia taxi]